MAKSCPQRENGGQAAVRQLQTARDSAGAVLGRCPGIRNTASRSLLPYATAVVGSQSVRGMTSNPYNITDSSSLQRHLSSIMLRYARAFRRARTLFAIFALDRQNSQTAYFLGQSSFESLEIQSSSTALSIRPYDFYENSQNRE